MFLYYLMNLMRIYTMIRYMHGVYVSYFFLKWLILSGHQGFSWILSFIIKPSLQIENKEQYYGIDIDDYVYIKYI